MNIGQRIRALRKQKTWTQAQLAEQVGTSEQYIRHLESGFRKPGRDTLIAVARVFGVAVDDLLTIAPVDLTELDTEQPNTPTVALAS